MLGIPLDPTLPPTAWWVLNRSGRHPKRAPGRSPRAPAWRRSSGQDHHDAVPRHSQRCVCRAAAARQHPRSSIKCLIWCHSRLLSWTSSTTTRTIYVKSIRTAHGGTARTVRGGTPRTVRGETKQTHNGTTRAGGPPHPVCHCIVWQTN